MSGADGPAREPVFEKLFGNLFDDHTRREEEKVREYVSHRLARGARLEEVLGEEYVRRHCSQEEIDGIVRDPRLARENRASLWRMFESGELDPGRGSR